MGSSFGHGSTGRRLHGKSVVVADDTPLFRRVLVRQLEVLGLDVRGVGSPSALERILEDQTPDAVLLDWHFGGATAGGILDRLRARWIPVIVVTGDPGAVDIRGVPVLGKPLQMQSLHAQLAEVLGIGHPEAVATEDGSG